MAFAIEMAVGHSSRNVTVRRRRYNGRTFAAGCYNRGVCNSVSLFTAKDIMPEVNEKDCWIGFDLGGTKMLAAVFDSKFKQLGSERKKTKGHLGVDAGLERMIGTIRSALDDASDVSLENFLA